MQTRIFLPLWLSALLMIAGNSCKKEDKVGPPSKTDILTAGTGQWKISVYTLAPPYDLDGDGTPDSDAYATFEPCRKDNYFVFKKDGTLETNEGASKLSPNDPQIEKSTWSFSNNETEITIDEILCTIQELTSSKLRVKAPIANSIGDITFVH